MHTDSFCRPEQPGTTYGQRLISADQLGTLCAEHQHKDIAYSCRNKRRFAHYAWTPNTCRVHSCTLKIASEKAQNYCTPEQQTPHSLFCPFVSSIKYFSYVQSLDCTPAFGNVCQGKGLTYLELRPQTEQGARKCLRPAC